MLNDSSGTIKAVGWNGIAKKLHPLFERGRVYVITKAAIINRRGQYPNNTRHNYELQFKYWTGVKLFGGGGGSGAGGNSAARSAMLKAAGNYSDKPPIFVYCYILYCLLPKPNEMHILCENQYHEKLTTNFLLILFISECPQLFLAKRRSGQNWFHYPRQEKLNPRISTHLAQQKTCSDISKLQGILASPTLPAIIPGQKRTTEAVK